MSKGKWKKHGTWIDLCPLRPSNRKHGDCSTRAMAYAFDLPYSVVQSLQIRLAKQLNARFNSWRVLNRLFRLFNYVPVHIESRMDCGKFAEYVKSRGYVYPVLVYSSAHLSIADDGCIVDNWDSRSKRYHSAWARRGDGFVHSTFRV